MKAAAEFLGVCPARLPNWGRAGQLEPRRHPRNRYRLSRRDEREALLRSVREGRLDA